MDDLTAKQRLFVLEYLKGRNAAEANFAAGISPGKGQYYVYFLIDSLTGAIFYVGKGKGRRYSQHQADARKGRIGNVEKHWRIIEILEAGGKVEELVFCRFEREEDAFALERALIHQFKEHGLTNIVGGVVTQHQQTKAVARHLLSRLKTYSDWTASLSPDGVRGVRKLFGDPKVFYLRFRLELINLALHGQQREVVCYVCA